jgi:hypothetical protein
MSQPTKRQRIQPKTHDGADCDAPFMHISGGAVDVATDPCNAHSLRAQATVLQMQIDRYQQQGVVSSGRLPRSCRGTICNDDDGSAHAPEGCTYRTIISDDDDDDNVADDDDDDESDASSSSEDEQVMHQRHQQHMFELAVQQVGHMHIRLWYSALCLTTLLSSSIIGRFESRPTISTHCDGFAS